MGRVNIHPELGRSCVTRFHAVPATGSESSYGSLSTGIIEEMENAFPPGDAG